MTLSAVIKTVFARMYNGVPVAYATTSEGADAPPCHVATATVVQLPDGTTFLLGDRVVLDEKPEPLVIAQWTRRELRYPAACPSTNPCPAPILERTAPMTSPIGEPEYATTPESTPIPQRRLLGDEAQVLTVFAIQHSGRTRGYATTRERADACVAALGAGASVVMTRAVRLANHEICLLGDDIEEDLDAHWRKAHRRAQALAKLTAEDREVLGLEPPR